jgi:uncharacterized membrane protein
MLYRYIRFLHIVASVIWLGGGVLLGVIALRARRSGDARLLGDFAKMLPYAGLRVFMPATVLVLLSGLSLVSMTEAWSFSQLWVWLAVGAVLVAVLMGVLYLSRLGLELERLSERPEWEPAMDEAAGRWLRGYGLVLVVLVFALWDMVFMPGL